MTIKTRKKPVAVKAKVIPKASSRPSKASSAKASPHKSSPAKEKLAESVTSAAAGEGVAERPITGRGVFAVRTIGNAVSVEAAFLAEDGNVLRFPAVFPNLEYAKSQIEELWQLVHRHFTELESQQTAGAAPVAEKTEPTGN